MKKILLMGNPNVGKSVVFSRLTGVNVVSSNYPGTTVEYTKGYMSLAGVKAEVIDVPGAYTLDPTCKAEEVAVEMLPRGDLIINVVDATKLERNLHLTLQLLEREVPVIIALNMWDETKHLGIEIDLEALKKNLGVPVVPTVAVTGEGIKELALRLPEAAATKRAALTPDQRWAEIGRITAQVQTISHRHHTWKDRLEDASIRPLTAVPMAILTMVFLFIMVRLLGEGLIRYLIGPIFDHFYTPFLMHVSSWLGSDGFLHDLFIGKLINGRVDLEQSLGVLSTGVFIELGVVLPYIFAFFLALGFLEDVGYLPRLAVLGDHFMHRLGLHGYAIIPTVLGLGCNVPGVMATRVLESRKERFIAATIMAIAVPCASLQAMIFGLVGERGTGYVAIVYGTLLALWFITGLILNRMLSGFSPEILIEIPPYRLPPPGLLLTKLRVRIVHFLKDAAPFVLLGVLFVNLLFMLGVMDTVASAAAPVVRGIFGLPEKAVSALIVGFLRKDLAVAMLSPLGLTDKQLVVGATVLSIYFPCAATFVILLKELGWKDMIKSAAIMVSAAILVGGALNLIL